MTGTSVFDEGQASIGQSDLERIVAAGRKAIGLEDTIAGIEEALKAHKKELHQIRTNTLPELLAAVGMSEFKMDDGTKIKVDEFVSGSLPKDESRRREAIEELEAIGGKGLMKDKLSMDFDKSQHNEALSLVSELKEKGYEPSFISNVHPQTLHSFIREKLKAGEQVNYERLGCYVGRVAKISVPKRK